MKFLNKNTENFIINIIYHDNTINYILEELLTNYNFEKNFKKSRKIISNTRIGVISNIKKVSLKRDKNFNLLNQYINLMQKKGSKINLFKNINLSVENLFFSLNHNLEEFSIYKNYPNYVYLHNNNYFFSDFNYLLNNSIENLESIFEIKPKKNNKKLKLPSKYTHEIVYIPKDKRLKYVLRSLSVYKENFKNYNLWERIFWSFFILTMNKNNSFLKKRRDYIYSKSIKFFKLHTKK